MITHFHSSTLNPDSFFSELVRHFKKVERRHDWCLILHFICFILPLTPKVAFHTIYNFSTPSSNSLLFDIMHAGSNCLSRLQCTLNFYVYALRDDRFRKAYTFFFREVSIYNNSDITFCTIDWFMFCFQIFTDKT